MKDGTIVEIKGNKYEFNCFYNRLDSIESNVPEIACPMCNGTSFEIKYGDYECIAVCKCGHHMTIYEG